MPANGRVGGALDAAPVGPPAREEARMVVPPWGAAGRAPIGPAAAGAADEALAAEAVEAAAEAGASGDAVTVHEYLRF